MLIVMSHNASDDEIRDVVHVIEELGYEARPIPGRQRTAVGLVGNDGRVDAGRLEGLPGVLEVISVSHPYKQVSREWKEEDTVVTLPNGTRIGGEEIAVIAGPCAVESEEQILQVARQLSGMGATVLRGGAFKPRTSPYSFQGLGEEGLKLLAQAREETGMAVVTEALDPDGASLVAEYADIIQIGARNMHNYALLRRAGRVGKPVLLKRGMSATIDELLLAAEYILHEGNPDVILCERGVRSFDTHTRNLLDLTAIPVAQKLSSKGDSHGASGGGRRGRRDHGGGASRADQGPLRWVSVALSRAVRGAHGSDPCHRAGDRALPRPLPQTVGSATHFWGITPPRIPSLTPPSDCQGAGWMSPLAVAARMAGADPRCGHSDDPVRQHEWTPARCHG